MHTPPSPSKNQAARRWATPLALALAAGFVAALPEPPSALAQNAPSADDAGLPIRAVTLYRSGVGSFSRQGLIDGSRTVSLRFETEQINDILKSMTLLDLDGGRVGSISYASQEPLERRLGSFAIDLSGNPSTASLLRQMRGADVRIVTFDGELFGRVISTEKKRVFNDEGQVAGESEFVNVLEDGRISSVDMRDVRFFSLQDEALQAELERALLALGANRADRTKAVELRFDGAPGQARRIIVSYVTEMPVWKTSYRLILDDENSPTIQGWAIVENTTDHDWTDVRLSLASGRPVSFTMDLYEPLFATRPEVPVPFLAGVAPRLYEAEANRAPARGRGGPASRAVGGGVGGLEEQRGLNRAFASSIEADDADLSLDYIDPGTVSLADYAPAVQASAEKAGEQFLYTVDAPVTIERQRSAMLPILASSIEGRRVSIYNAAANRINPMRGIELTNDSGLHLMPGPIAVFDASIYAGDAQIPHTSRNQTRLLSYAVDLDVTARIDDSASADVRTMVIADGVLVETSKAIRSRTYTFSNASADLGRTILVEHPRSSYTLVNPEEPAETVSNLYRFEVEVEPGGSAELFVEEELVYDRRYDLATFDRDRLRLLSRGGKVSRDVMQAFTNAAALHAEAARLAERDRAITQEMNAISTDQRRVRDNLAAVREGTDLYRRYIDKLTDQEDSLDRLRSEQATVRERADQRRQELADYLRGLNVS